jgi:CRISPR system Cascade subunit CasE
VNLHMLQLAPDMARLIRWAEPQRLLHPRQEDDLGYALHAALRAAFADQAPAPFALLRHPVHPPKLLAYSSHPAATLREHAAAFAEPEAIAILGLANLAEKPMPDRFASGRRLGFSLRARPVVRTDRDGDRTRARERDAFLAAIEGTAPDAGPSRGEVYQAWLAHRLAEGGAWPEQLVLDSFRLTTTLRRASPRQDGARQLHGLLGPDAGFSGVLSVIDPDRFVALLARSVGRHRAFGFGMLLLKPA